MEGESDRINTDILVDKYADLKLLVKKIKKENEDLKAQKKTLEGEVTALKSKIQDFSTIRDANARLRVNLTKVSENNSSLQAEISQLRKKVENLTKQNETLQGEIAGKNKVITAKSNVEAKKKRLEESLKTANNQIASLQGYKSNVEVEKKRLEESLKKANNRIASLQGYINKLLTQQENALICAEDVFDRALELKWCKDQVNYIHREILACLHRYM